MVKGLFVINVLCFITATISGSPTGMVNEFKINNPTNDIPENVENKEQHLNPIGHAPGTSEKNADVLNDSNGNQKLTDTDTLFHHSSVYTEADLEETASHDKLDGPNTEEKEIVHENEKNTRNDPNKKEEMSSVYTESDLEATTSQDVKKKGEHRDKRSVGSFLIVAHNDGFGEGSGSGQEPPDL